MELARSRQLKADISLALVTLIWGATFVAVKSAVAHMQPFTFIAVRFAAASLFLLAVSPGSLRRLNRQNLGAGLLTGLFLFAGYSFQTIGLKYTTASNAGFITGLSVVLVPLLVTLTTRSWPGLFTSLGVLSATAGLALLTLGAGFSLNHGDLLILLCAVSFALQIMAVARFAPQHDPMVLAFVQITVVAAASGLAGLIWEPQPPVFTGEVWVGLLVTAIPATSLAFLVQTRMQQFTTPTRTAIIFASEPVFSAVFAYFLAGETLRPAAALGACLILAGMLVSELKPSAKSPAAELK